MIDESPSLYRNCNEIKGVCRNFPTISTEFPAIPTKSFQNHQKNPKSENEFRLRISEPKFHLNLYRIWQGFSTFAQNLDPRNKHASQSLIQTSSYLLLK